MTEEMNGIVTIEPHPATEDIHGVEVRLFPQQRQVCVNGVRVAYCGAAPHTPLSFIRHYPEQYRTWLVGEVEKQIGQRSSVGAPPIVAEFTDEAVDE